MRFVLFLDELKVALGMEFIFGGIKYIIVI